jgi:hypothetical protein
MFVYIVYIVYIAKLKLLATTQSLRNFVVILFVGLQL